MRQMARTVPLIAALLLCGCPPSEPPPEGTPVIAVSPDALDFGAVSFTDAPITTAVVTVTNEGDADLELGDITLAGEYFDLPGVDRSGRVLRPGRSLDITVQIHAEVDGERQARLRIPSNAGDAIELPVFADVHAPAIDVSPWSHDFGNPVVGCAPRLTVTIENVGREDLLVTSVEMDGNDEWALETPVVDVTIAPGATTEAVARYQPDDPEPDDAELLIQSNAPELPKAIVELEGRSHFETEATETFDGGATRYPLTFGAVWETIRVFVNGDRVFSGWSYDDSSGPALVFQGGSAPGEGDSLRVVYIALGSC